LQYAKPITPWWETEMPETPTFGRYAEIPYDQMTPEQQEGYRFLVEIRGGVGGPSKIWVHDPKLATAAAPLGAHFHPGHYSLTEREREQVVYETAMAPANSRWVPQGLCDRAVKAFGHVGMTDPITLLSCYTSVSMTLAFYDVPAGAQGMAR
jgi:4-carboxymuconolactone decarboxylase